MDGCRSSLSFRWRWPAATAVIPRGRLLLHSAPSVAEGRSWSLAKAAQLIRNDARPNLGWLCRWTTGPGVCSGPAAACSAAVSNWLLKEAMQKPVQRWCR